MRALLVAALGCAAAEGPCAPPAPEALDAWLRAGCYTEWQAGSPAVRRSDMGPGGVRVFLSPDLAQTTGDAPLGSGAVREMYAPDLTTRVGWSASIKTATGWFWFERFDALPRPSVASREAPGCTGCHAHGLDFVQSPRGG